MSECVIDYSKLFEEVEEVKALLLTQGITNEINVNEIFAKLERRQRDTGRVDVVVQEIIAESKSEPDLIVLGEVRKERNVSLLIDLTDSDDGENHSENEVERGNVQSRGIKRSLGDRPDVPQKSRPSNEIQEDNLFDDTLNLEDVALIEEITASCEVSLPEVEKDEYVFDRCGEEGATQEESDESGESNIEIECIPANDVPDISIEEDGTSVEKFTAYGNSDVVQTEIRKSHNQTSEEKRDENFKILRVNNESTTQTDAIDINNISRNIIKNFDENASSSGQYSNKSAHLDFICSMFPNVEISYLKRIVDLYSGDERGLHAFIGEALKRGFQLPEVKKEEPSCSSFIKLNTITDDPTNSGVAGDEGEASGTGGAVHLPMNGSADGDSARTQLGAEVAEMEGDQKRALDEKAKEDLYAEQLRYLIAVLPDADPTFLEELVKNLEGNAERLREFVANCLEKQNNRPLYPTRQEKQQKQEQEELAKRFTENFSVEDFLEAFPDPEAYFESENREPEHKYMEHYLAYLRSKFRNLYMNDITRVLRMKKMNLSLAAKELSQWTGSRRKAKRSDAECRWPSEQYIPFLQEVAYIENKHKIDEFREDKKKKRQQAYGEAKENGQLVACGCCFDEELLAEDMATCRDGHLFCIDCIRKGAEVLIGDGKSKFPCMEGNCQAEFTLATLQTILAPKIFGKLVQRLQSEEINAAGIEGLETCPACPYSTIPAAEDKVFKCLNPECMRETCRSCKEPSHIPLRCEEVEKNEEIKARTYIEDKMTEALVRTCWKCNKKFIKEGGCNKMCCTCGAAMCYICREPVTDYKHFNPEPGRKSKLCPLYSDDGKVNFEAVKAEAERAKEEVLKQNPEVNLKHDPTLKLPDRPSTSNAHPVPPFMEAHGFAIPDNVFGLFERVLGVPQHHMPRPHPFPNEHVRMMEVRPIVMPPNEAHRPPGYDRIRLIPEAYIRGRRRGRVYRNRDRMPPPAHEMHHARNIPHLYGLPNVFPLPPVFDVGIPHDQNMHNDHPIPHRHRNRN